MENKKQLVKEVIIKAVPSVTDLVFGCIVEDGRGEAVLLGKYTHVKENLYEGISSRGSTVVATINKIIGRPIQLADVLVAIEKINGTLFGVDSWSVLVSSYAVAELLEKWDLSQDFDHQSEAFYLFVWELLV